MAATNIKTNLTLAEGIYYSDEIASATNLDIQAILSAGATGQIKYTIQRATTNGAWRDAKDDAGKVISFVTINDVQDGVNLVGLNAAKARVKIEVTHGSTGTLNLEYESIS